MFAVPQTVIGRAKELRDLGEFLGEIEAGPIAFVLDGELGIGKTVLWKAGLAADIPGVFAAGDVRSGSTKRCATAVGEGAMAVQFGRVHRRRDPRQDPHPALAAPAVTPAARHVFVFSNSVDSPQETDGEGHA